MLNLDAAAKRHQQAQRLFEDSIEVKKRTISQGGIATIVRLADRIADSIADGGKLMLCGNGGSAADAQHLAAELLVRLRPMVNRDSVAAMTLATDISMITACGNDYSFDEIFSRPLRGLGKKGDVLLGITTSGRSPNVLRALEAAKDMGISRFAFLGGDGGPALSMCEEAFIVPSSDTGRIQEVHITAGHALMELVEDLLLENGKIHLT